MAQAATDLYPVLVLDEVGGLSASIYHCRGQEGDYFTVTFSRFFRYRGRLYRTHLFRDDHLLPIGRLAERCHDSISRFKLQMSSPSR